MDCRIAMSAADRQLPPPTEHHVGIPLLRQMTRCEHYCPWRWHTL